MRQKNIIICSIFQIAFLIISTYTTKAQHLISYQFLDHYTKQDIQQLLADYGISASVITPEFAVDYYKVTYNTRNAQNTGNTIATGALVVPTGITCPLPLLSYQHGTTSKRIKVPSARGGAFEIGVIGAALTGSVTAMPDYLGLGDSPGFHPYVHAASEATAVIDLLRTARELKDSIGYNLNDQLFLFGYSQGGHATMSAFKELETNFSSEFTVTACVPMSGPYDISGVQSTTMTADTPYATPGYLPYVILGYQEAYGNLYNNLSEIFKSPYDTLLPDYFDGTHGIGWINNRLPDTPNLMLDSAYFQSFINDPNHFVWSLLKDNDLYNWAPQAPLSIYYCTGDEQVFYENALVARDSMHALGATHVIAVNFGQLNHNNCAPLCFLSGLALFDQYIDLSGGMIVHDSITNPSTASASNGSITISVSNGNSPYIYEWQGGLAGQTTATIQGLSEGNYEVRISDSIGCFLYEDITLTAPTSITDIEAYKYFKLMPNPADNFIYLKILAPLSDKIHISIIDMSGKVIYETKNALLALYRYDISELKNGVYLVRLQSQNKAYTQKLIINH